MKKETPVCGKCPNMKVIGRAGITSGTARGGPRGNCLCEHPDAVAAFNKVCPHSPRMAGFIGYTAPGGDVPQIKTSPRWCPLKEVGQNAGDHSVG